MPSEAAKCFIGETHDWLQWAAKQTETGDHMWTYQYIHKNNKKKPMIESAQSDYNHPV